MEVLESNLKQLVEKLLLELLVEEILDDVITDACFQSDLKRFITTLVGNSLEVKTIVDELVQLEDF